MFNIDCMLLQAALLKQLQHVSINIADSSNLKNGTDCHDRCVPRVANCH